tara:strand:+ start:862 stop:1320 length:459 start_codon:yes stop_codon:yes gene_type:complete
MSEGPEEQEEDEDGWMEIINLHKLADFSRKIIYHNFDESNDEYSDQEFLEIVTQMKLSTENYEELEQVLPIQETKNILKSLCILKHRKKRTVYLIKEDDYDEFLVQLGQRMISNIVLGLVKKGLVDSAFDDEKNDFVFWVKKKNDNENEKTD